MRQRWLVVMVAAAALVVALLAPINAAQAATGPIVQIVSPAPNSEVAGSVTVVFNASSSYGIASIDVQDSYGAGTSGAPDVFGCTLSGTQCSLTIDVVIPPDGADDITVTALDANGISGTTTVTVIVNNNRSQAVLYDPTDGAMLSGSVVLQAAPTNGATTVDFYVDGFRLVGTSSCDNQTSLCSQTWNTRSWPNGAHQISVGGFDGNHDAAGAPITVYLSNATPPTLRLTSSKSVIASSSTLTFTARLTSNGGGALSGQTVTFTGKTESGSSIYLGTSRTSSSGVATVHYKLTEPAKVIARSTANTQYDSATDSTLVRGSLAVAVSSARRTARRGSDFSLTVSTLPRRVNVITVQSFYYGAWHDVSTASTNSAGKWTGRFVARIVGTRKLRAYVHATVWRDKGASKDRKSVV